VGGIAVVVAAAVFLSATLRSDGAVGPAGTPTSGGSYVAPAIPYLFPEPWVQAEPTPAEIQAKVDAGEPSEQWRKDPEEVVHRFAALVLGWDGYRVGSQESTLGAQTWGIAPDCTIVNCSPDAYEVIRLVQPASQGVTGIWSVESVRGDRLRLSWKGSGSALSTLVPGQGIALEADANVTQPVAVGSVAGNGCITAGGAGETLTSSEVAAGVGLAAPGLAGSADHTGVCGSVGAAYAFAYTLSSGRPGGEPFGESLPMRDLTMLPFLVNAGSASSAPSTPATPPGPVGVRYCNDAPVAIVTILQRNSSLGGCVAWAADRPITLILRNRDSVHVQLKLSGVSACDRAGCSEAVWTSAMMKGVDTRSFSIDPLRAGRYVLWDAVHPQSRLDIVVG
jgi:hypothetical protein